MYCSKCGYKIQNKVEITKGSVYKVCSNCGETVELMGYLLSQEEYHFIHNQMRKQARNNMIEDIERDVKHMNNSKFRNAFIY